MPTAVGPELPGRRLLARGFLLQTANPKALLFFTALLPQFIRPEQPITVQVLILALTSFVVELFVLAGYGFLAGGLTEFAGRPRFLRTLNRITGGLLGGAGAGLALAGDR